jgi:glycosyltransferase involved in cell wall biosynthesis
VNENNSHKISIIIPCLNGSEYIEELYTSLSNQTYQNFNVIFINSITESSFKTTEIIKKFLNIDTEVISTEPLPPGGARNLGVTFAETELIGFLDMRTIPRIDWLQQSINLLNEKKLNLITGSFVCRSKTKFQTFVQAATFGNMPANSLPGSIIKKNTFEEIGGFVSEARAGEDQEWLTRAKQIIPNIGILKLPTIEYIGLPESSVELFKKWFFYSLENASIEVAQSQKTAYFFVISLLFIYFFFNWNYIFTNDEWDQSPYFIPHINKIIWSIFFFIYFLFRGIIFPYQKGVKLNFIFPFNWFGLIIACIIIDISKIPGRVLGYIYFLKTKYLTN